MAEMESPVASVMLPPTSRIRNMWNNPTLPSTKLVRMNITSPRIVSRAGV